MPVRVSSLCLLVCCGITALTSAADLLDPAPPKAAKLPAMAAPKAADYDRVTFHAAPKPLPKGAQTHDWTSFLGPTHNGISTETKLLKNFPKTGLKAVWELSKGIGYASPGIQGDYLVYPHRVKNEVIVECLHPATGKKYWEHRYETEYQDRYGYGSGPRASPVIDGDFVYILGVEGQFACLELKTGRVTWQRQINQEFKVPQDFFGTVGTPLLMGDVLILNVGAPGGPCVVGFDKHTGKVVWRAGEKWGPSYASPIPGVIHGQPRAFVFAGGDSQPPTGGLLSINPANGKVDFEYPWRSKKYESVNASCPVVLGNSVFISATYRAGSTLLKIGSDFKPTPAWSLRDTEHNETDDAVGLHWNTAVHHDGYFYAFDGRNEPDASMVCFSAKDGKVAWRKIPEWQDKITLNGETRAIDMSTLRGNLLRVDGRFLCLGEYGHLLWLDLTPQGYKELDRTMLFLARDTWALPVLSRGLLYISQNNPDIATKKGARLVCYDLRGDE